MNWIIKLVAPMVINQILDQLSPERIKAAIAAGADEIEDLVGEGFDYLVKLTEESDNKFDDKLLAMAREVVTDLIDSAIEAGKLSDLLELLAVGLVKLAKRTDNELDDTLAEGLLDAVRSAQD